MTIYAKLNFISLFYKQKYTFILYFLSLHPPTHITHFCSRTIVNMAQSIIYTHKNTTGGRSVHDQAQKLLSSRMWDTPEILESCQQRTGWTCWPPAQVILQHWIQLIKRQIRNLLFTSPRRARQVLSARVLRVSKYSLGWKNSCSFISQLL